MPRNYLFLLGFIATILTGCGLENDTEEDTDTASVTVDVEQSPYLPLTNASTFYYSQSGASTQGDIRGRITFDVGASSNRGYSVYRITIRGGSQDLDLLLRSTRDQIYLLGLDGPLTPNASTLVDHLRFTNPIPLLGARSDETTGASADITVDGNAVGNPEILYDVSNSQAPVFNNAGWELPTLRATVDAQVTVDLGGAGTAEVPLELVFFFTRGLGLVQHSARYNNATNSAYELVFESLEGVPNIVAFTQDGNNANGTSSLFTLAEDPTTNTPINSGDYRVVNLAELSALGWLQIQENAQSQFTAAINTNSPQLPDVLTSIQVLFEDRYDGGERLSANVTLLGP
ncbi:MAG: hypothetical protein CML06_07840 [Pseudomonadales bacterium]|nr:hypothetical protein [Pseudomonadales bacterium]